ncbi:hypothetical protein KP79_PYT02645 [Mizuhopecten yessoensis]|uniref:G-protein coupled receptors family 1 profile domain-containing protein n=1 Tax=Mizuhopecten yessoensis TaxID=6573 RepID=A0A210PK97_MIZYE|nr:hypothetical protein KP79_PYT02645 [Mizuhopecten yessoensis]
MYLPAGFIRPMFYSAMGVISLCLNGCVFVAMALSKSITKRVRTPLMNLCVSDFINSTPMILFAVTNMESNYPLCYFGLFLMTFSISVSSTVVFLLSVDRCICLYFETSYMKYVTNKRVRAMYVTVWIIVPALTYVRIGRMDAYNTKCLTMNRSYREVVFVCCAMFVRFLTLLFSVGTVLKMRAIRNRMPTVKGEFHNTIKLIFIVCMYQAMFVPLSIHHLIWVTRPDLMDTLELFWQSSTMMMIGTSIINPLLYTLRFTECRLSMLLIICRWNKIMSRRIEYKKKQLLAPFLVTRERQLPQNFNLSDFPHSVIVLEFVSEQEQHRAEMTQQTQAVSVIDVPSEVRRSPTPTLITVNPAT